MGAQPKSDNDFRVFESAVTGPDRAGLGVVAPSEPEAPLNVVRSLRLPTDLNERLERAAETEGIAVSVFIRRAIESALGGSAKSNLVSLDDVYRALGALPKAAA